jgi:electron transfer flavoprotein beta subunit
VHSFLFDFILYFRSCIIKLLKQYKMKILVCISHVPDTTSKINFTNGDSEFDTNGVQFVINPNDEFGLTRAIWFKEQQGANVTVVNVGGADAEATLRKALAIGADEAIRINANPTDGMFVAKQLATVVKNGGYDLVIAGKESLDYNGGMVPGMLAGILGYNFVNACVGIDLNGNEAKLTREIDGGKEIISANLPLVIPNMRGIMMARTKVLSIVEPNGDAAATKSIKFEKPAAKSAVKLINADNLDELISLLHNEAKVI